MTVFMIGGPFLLKKWTFLSALKSKWLYYANLPFRMIAHLLISKIHKHGRVRDTLVRYLPTTVFSTYKKKGKKYYSILAIEIMLKDNNKEQENIMKKSEFQRPTDS